MHPLVRKILEGGERVAWGAKALPGGGYWSMPKLTMPGALLVGDAGGHGRHGRAQGRPPLRSSRACWPPRRSTRALKRGESTFESYEQAVEESSIGKELYEVRNTRQPFQKGFLQGGPLVNLMIATKGKLPRRALAVAPQRRASRCSSATRQGRYPKPDGKYTFDKLSSRLHHRQRDARRRARTTSACRSTCRARSPRRGAGCARPGSTRSPRTRPRTGDVDVIVNYTNCVQCGAITAKGGRLTTPEGGDGPLYQIT